MSQKYVYVFGGKRTSGNGQMQDLLGGKGANLAEMARLGIPVPAGFTISTEVCAAYYREGGGQPHVGLERLLVGGDLSRNLPDAGHNHLRGGRRVGCRWESSSARGDDTFEGPHH